MTLPCFLFLRMKVVFPFCLLLLASVGFSEVGPPPADEVERLSLEPFYKKYLSCRGFPIVSSGKVSDYALLEAAHVIEQMLGTRQDILDAMTDNKVRLVIMAPDEFTTDVPEHSDLEPKAYWDKRARGLGATSRRPAVSVGEENVLGYAGDPYATESILVHEFAHALHQMGIRTVDPDFQLKLDQTFNRSTLAGLWKGKYAGTNSSEYWAEAVQSWFDTNRENDPEHNHVDTREELQEHDPGIAALVESIFGDGEWRYSHPRERLDDPHLEGYQPESAPAFSWPKEMIAAYEAIERGDGLKAVEMQPIEKLARDAATKDSGRTVSLRIENKRGDQVSVYWIGFDGIRRHYGDLDPGRRKNQQTYGSHLWVVLDERGKEMGWFSMPEEDALLVLK